jgi:hypothetical protein
MDPKRKKIQSSRIHMKLVPSHSSHRADFDSILFFKNGLCMAKLSRSEVKVKQEKSQGQSQQFVLLMLA